MTIVLKNSRGELITKWEEWTRPKRSNQWKEGRSAMELALSWFASQTLQCPPELQALVSTNNRTSSIQLDEGCPEFITGLPMSGGQRNHDLMLKAHTAGESVVICVEAKVDESFGIKIGDYWRETKARKIPTRVPERIEALLGVVFGEKARPDQKPWSELRYQLLTGVAGTLIQAVNNQSADKSMSLAVFVVHEIHTEDANQKLLMRNDKDYTDFVKTLFSVSSVNSGQMYGPLLVPQSKYLSRPVELLIGKAVG